MGAQRVSERLVRLCRRETGLDVVAAWNHGDAHGLAIVTADHRHGWWDRRQNTVTFDPELVALLPHLRRTVPLPPQPGTARSLAS